MKKFILSISVFVPFAFAVYFLINLTVHEISYEIMNSDKFFGLGGYGHLYTRLNEAKEVEDIDILFLGSSHCYRGFDNRVFEKAGYKSFNLGSSSQTPYQTKVLLNRYLNTLNPKLVVFEVYPKTFELDGVESGLDLVANDKNDIHSFLMSLRINHKMIYSSFFYGLYRDLLNKNKGFKEEFEKKCDKYISGGFVEREMEFYKVRVLAEHKLKLDVKQLNCFKGILQNLKDREVNYILVESPVTKSLHDSYSNYDSINDQLSSLGEFVDFNQLMELNDSLHFYDSDHLNQVGVELFNNRLIDVFESKGWLKAN